MTRDGRAAADFDSQSVLAELRDIFDVSRETFEALKIYRQLLSTWQKRTNLVGPSTLDDFWTRHVADSLQVAALFPESRRWIDLGSGAGFPGMVVAIAHLGLADCHHVLVESNGKKCAFLRTVARETGAVAEILNERIESVAERFAAAPNRPEVVTARALAPLGKLLELSAPMLEAGAVGLFHKGREYQGEIEDCRSLWRFDLVIHQSRIAAGSVLLEVRNPARVQGSR